MVTFGFLPQTFGRCRGPMNSFTQNECGFIGGDNHRWWEHLKISNFMHSQAVDAKLRALALAPITNHLVKLSLPNILSYTCA